jgi:hypothetical protein
MNYSKAKNLNDDSKERERKRESERARWDDVTEVNGVNGLVTKERGLELRGRGNVRINNSQRDESPRIERGQTELIRGCTCCVNTPQEIYRETPRRARARARARAALLNRDASPFNQEFIPPTLSTT